MSATAPIIMLTNAVAPDKLGGLERYVRELSAALVTAGRPVTVVTKQIDPDQPITETGADGVVIERYPVPSKRDPLFAAKYPVAVARAVDAATRQGGAGAVLHSHFVVPALAPALRKLPYVHTFHAPTYRELLDERHDSYVLPAGFQRGAVAGLRAAERFVLQRADVVIALSEFIREEIRILDSEVARRAVVLPGGVDLGRFSNQPAASGVVATGLPLLVAARRLTPRTGVLELVRAMPSVHHTLPGARLVVLGDGGSRTAIESEISRLNLGSFVHLMGRVSDAELVSWYRHADLVVMPTQALEGFGLTTVEALACGTPVVATPIGANPEILAQIDRRLLMDGVRPAEIATGIIRAWRLIGQSGSDGVVPAGAMQQYSWDEIVARHNEIYNASAPAAQAAREPSRLRRAS